LARLVLTAPDGLQLIELREHNSIGRHPSNTIQLLDRLVSKEHCLIEREGDAFVLKDLGSMNGTFVNGHQVSGQQVLKHGDRLTIGATKGQFDEGADSPLSRTRSLPAPPSSVPGATDASIPVTSRTIPAPGVGPFAAPSGAEQQSSPTESAPSAQSPVNAQLMALQVLLYVRSHTPCWRESVHRRLVPSSEAGQADTEVQRYFEDAMRRLETLGLIDRPTEQGPISISPLVDLLEVTLGLNIQELAEKLKDRASR
jgi:pSer/pThr/pTyr-binding forkhead associated (FHA) protein